MIERDIYTKSFTEDHIPSWLCPRCHRGVLRLQEGKFLKDYTSETKNAMKEDWFEPVAMVTLTFTSILLCTNPKCKETIVCSGDGYVDEEYKESIYSEVEHGYFDVFQAKYFFPPLHIFQIPDIVPENVKQAIILSFSLIFSNQSAAANQIRIALECLLTHLKVKRFEIVRRKRKRLNLHKRIELLPVKYQKIKEVCLAIKWLGNAGSHCDDFISLDDVFDGYDMLAFVLDELYDNKHKHVKKLAKKINERKGV